MSGRGGGGWWVIRMFAGEMDANLPVHLTLYTTGHVGGGVSLSHLPPPPLSSLMCRVIGWGEDEGVWDILIIFVYVFFNGSPMTREHFLVNPVYSLSTYESAISLKSNKSQ